MWIIANIIVSSITACIVVRVLIEAFLKKVEKIDEQYRKELVEVVVETINKKHSG